MALQIPEGFGPYYHSPEEFRSLCVCGHTGQVHYRGKCNACECNAYYSTGTWLERLLQELRDVEGKGRDIDTVGKVVYEDKQ